MRLGFSVIFITHDLSLLVEISDSLAIMYAGKICEYGPSSRIVRGSGASLYEGAHEFPSRR